jgi:ParB family transcriptional regulator, chromosome partitioning protein
MARKNLLVGLDEPDGSSAPTAPTAYPTRGAAKSMIRSVGDLARQADAYLEGESIVEIETELIDRSFVADRIGDNEEEYATLREAIRDGGQNTPVLLRPHPVDKGRYMIVFGHRRVRVARELGRNVRAVVKNLSDEAHVTAQGHENSARANLTFVEKANFAKQLEALGYRRDVIVSSLGSNEASISKMISVATRIPSRVIEKIGAAPGAGRERWVALSLLVGKKPDEVAEFLNDPDINQLPSDQRFDQLWKRLNSSGKRVRKGRAKQERTWSAPDRTLNATFSRSGKKTMLALEDPTNAGFGSWIAENLDSLYKSFQKFKSNTNGD